MFCLIYRWMVSRSHDTGKPLSGAAARHIERCSECSAFARSTESLSTGLRRDAREFLRRNGENGTALDEKIISSLTTESKPVRIPRRRFMPVPAFAAAVLVVLITAAILFRSGPVSTPGPGTFPPIDVPGTIDTPDVLQDIAVKVESPIETEMHSLEQSVKSAAKSLLSGLDPKIKG